VRRRETAAIIVLTLILVGMPATLLGYQYGWRQLAAPTRIIDITVSMAGGFRPNSVQVNVGEPVTLRFTSEDVMHGVAIGPPLGIDLGNLEAGHVKEMTLTFDHIGQYTVYCNVWSNPDSWRMRGVIEVRDPGQPGVLPTPTPDPVMEALAVEGIDIDSRPARPNTPGGSDEEQTGGEEDEGSASPDAPERPWIFNYRWPSAERGAQRVARLIVPVEVTRLLWRRSHTPLQAADLLASANPAVLREDVFDVVAHLWTHDLNVSPATIRLYEKNCVACHGQTGDGQGPGARFTVMRPVAFTDLTRLFDRRSDVLYAKIWRGGNGTHMPEFGTVFRPDEIWALVDYIWKLGVSN
jgi:plastocyanin